MSIKACLIRVGIEKSRNLGGFSSWKKDNDDWEWIPFSGSGFKTYEQIKGRTGLALSNYVPNKLKNYICHYDPNLLNKPPNYGESIDLKKNRKVNINKKIDFFLNMPKKSLMVFYAPFWNPDKTKSDNFPNKMKYATDFNDISIEIFGFIEAEKVILIKNEKRLAEWNLKLPISDNLINNRINEGFLEVISGTEQKLNVLLQKFENPHLETNYFNYFTFLAQVIVIGTAKSRFLNRLIPIGYRKKKLNRSNNETSRDYILDDMADLLGIRRELDITQAGSHRNVNNPSVLQELFNSN